MEGEDSLESSSSIYANIRETSPVAAASVSEQILWWIGNAAEAFILVRSIKGKLYARYPAFYFYLGAVLLVELFRFSAFVFYPHVFPILYWYTEFLPAVVGYAVIFEIYKKALKTSPGAARMARIILWAILAAVILKVVAGEFSNPIWSPQTALTELERNLRTVQALLLIGTISLLTYYAVPIGRNLGGIMFGYTFYVCASVIALAFGSLPGYGIRPEWRHVQPIAYMAALLIWIWGLWSYQPDPEIEAELKIDRDYRLVAEHTRRALSKLRSYLKIGGEL